MIGVPFRAAIFLASKPESVYDLLDPIPSIPIPIVLFVLVYVRISHLWYQRTVYRGPALKQTYMAIALLALAGAFTSYLLPVAALLTVSCIAHLHPRVWEPFHTGIVCGTIGGLLVVALAVSIGGVVPSSWVQSSGQVPAFAVAAIVGAAATKGAATTGHPAYYPLAVLRDQLPNGKVKAYARTSPYRGLSEGAYKYERKRYNQRECNRAPERLEELDCDPETLELDPEHHPFKQAESDATADPRAEQSNDSQNSRKSESNEMAHADDANDSDEEKTDTVQVNDDDYVNGEEDEILPGTEQVAEKLGIDMEPLPFDEFQFPWETPPDVRFEDIGGYDDVKEELELQVINPSIDPSGAYERFNVDEIGGLLFYGPPGTGKTLFARALANRLDRPFAELTQADLTHHHINKSPRLIKRGFQEAQVLGSVVFIDEAEQLVAERSDLDNAHAEDRKVTNMLLTMLSLEEQNFIVIMTTNRSDQIDEAIKRSGRIDEEFHIDYPDMEARKEILKLNLEDVSHELVDDHITVIADQTDRWSGADLEALADRAKMLAAHQDAPALRFQHFKKAYQKLRSNVTERYD